MGRTKSFVYNCVTTSLLQICVTLVGVVLPRVILKFYGSEINGLVSSLTQFINYFNLVEAGLASAAVYALYKPLADKNKETISEVVSTTKKFYFKAGYIFVGLVISLAVIYPYILNNAVLDNYEIFILTIILGASGFLDFFTLAKYRALLTADQKLYIISIASIIYYILNTIIIVVLASLGLDIITTRFIALFAILMRSIILKVYVNKKYKYIDYKYKTNNKLLNKRWDALYLQILGSIQTGAPVVILTICQSLTTVSIYTIYNMIIGGINGILSIFSNGLAASFGDIIIRKEENTLKKATRDFEYMYYNVITVIYSVAFITIMPFVALYTTGISDANYYLPIVGALFVINGFLYNLKTPQGMLVISAGMYKETRKQSTIQGLIILVLGFTLAPFLGIVGVLIASIVSNIYRDIDLLIFIPKKLTHLPIRETLKKQIKSIILAISIIVTCYIIKFDINSYFDWFVFAILCCIIALIEVATFDLIFCKKDLKNILDRIKQLFRRKNESNL